MVSEINLLLGCVGVMIGIIAVAGLVHTTAEIIRQHRIDRMKR